MSKKQEHLKKVILKYQETNDKELFAKILEAYDGMLCHVAKKFFGVIPGVEKQDLYHTAIIGLQNAVSSVPVTEKPETLPLRVAVYARLEILKTYKKEFKHAKHSRIFAETSDGGDSSEVFNEMSSLKTIMQQMIAENNLTLKELELLKKHFVDGKTFTELAEEKKPLGKRTKIYYMVKEIVEKIRIKAEEEMC